VFVFVLATAVASSVSAAPSPIDRAKNQESRKHHKIHKGAIKKSHLKKKTQVTTESDSGDSR
jgi:hypothetical protein